MIKKLNHQGLTLIELLVAVAISSMVGLAVCSFMVVGARSFQKTSADVNVQNEAQLVVNQVQDLLVDTNVGVESTDSATQKVFTMYNYHPSDDSQNRVFEIVYEIAEEKLYYSEYQSVASTIAGKLTATKGAVVHDKQLLGEDITEFKVDLSALEKKRVVRLDLTVEQGTSKYHCSTNITLRNTIMVGSEIPAYIEESKEINDPLKVAGLTEFYVEPGAELNLLDAGGYRIKKEDNTDASEQDLRFFILDSTNTAAGTAVSTSGILNVSRGQKNDFDVVVASRSGNATTLTVSIKLIIVDSVDVTLKQATRKSALPEGMGDNCFGTGDSFTLEANVRGRNLDKASSSITGVQWAVAPGSTQFIKDNPVVSGNTATFTLKDSYKVDQLTGMAAFAITATSTRSLQIPYYVGNTPTPVVGTYSGTAYMEQGDFEIVGAANLLRGKHDISVSMVQIAGDIKDAIPGFDESKHRLFAKVQANELTYKQQENAVSNVYTIRKDVTDTGSTFKGEGIHMGVVTPNYDEASPNVAFEYETTFYIFEKRENDHTNWQNLTIIWPGESSKDGYDIKDAKYQSNTVTQRCDRLYVYYNHRTFGKNEDGSINYSSWVGDYTTTLCPRNTFDLGYRNNRNKWVENVNVVSTIPIYTCSSVENNGTINAMGNQGFKLYCQQNGSWVEFGPDSEIKKDGKYPDIANCLEARYENGSLRVTYNTSKWKDSASMPKVIRIVPCISYKTGSSSEKQDGIFFDSYVDTYLWNIEVPVVEDYQEGIPGKIGEKKKSLLYFPCPLEDTFSVVQTGDYKEWANPYPANTSDENINNKIKDIKLSYKLAYNADGSGNKTWYLHLRYYDQAKSKFVNVGAYRCAETSREWTRIEYSELPTNLNFTVQ